MTYPELLNDKTIPILFVDDTSILVTSSNPIEFHKDINTFFNNVNEWFRVNFFSLNSSKTHYVVFTTNTEPLTDINITYNNNKITAISGVKFLGIHANDTLSWKIHIENIIPKLSTFCYIMRSIKPYMSLNTLRMVYYSYFNSVINYGLIFWGNSQHSITIFRLQKT